MNFRKILVCDDSSADRQNLERIVGGTGCVVLSCSSGKEAIEMAKAEQPDLIFLDIIMPEMDGYAACRALQEDPETKRIPIVFVTSKQAKADRVWAEMQGGKDFVSKPVSEQTIVEQIRKSG